MFVGLEDPELPRYVHEGLDFLYMDNAYFKRGPRSTNFRLIRRGFHLTRLLDRPADRRQMWGVNVKPWKSGRNVIVIPPSPWYVGIMECGAWLDETMAKISTDRPIIIKRNKREPLADYLADAHCLVTYGSVAGLEALLAGIPVFSGPLCPTLPVSAGSLSDIENPKLLDREPLLRSLAYANWKLDEIPKLNLKDYDYRCES